MKPFLDSKLFLTLAGSLTNASEDWVVEEHSGSRNESDRNSTARNTRTPATGHRGGAGRTWRAELCLRTSHFIGHKATWYCLIMSGRRLNSWRISVCLPNTPSYIFTEVFIHFTTGFVSSTVVPVMETERERPKWSST